MVRQTWGLSNEALTTPAFGLEDVTEGCSADLEGRLALKLNTRRKTISYKNNSGAIQKRNNRGKRRPKWLPSISSQ